MPKIVFENPFFDDTDTSSWRRLIFWTLGTNVDKNHTLRKSVLELIKKNWLNSIISISYFKGSPKYVLQKKFIFDYNSICQHTVSKSRSTFDSFTLCFSGGKNVHYRCQSLFQLLRKRCERALWYQSFEDFQKPNIIERPPYSSNVNIRDLCGSVWGFNE